MHNYKKLEIWKRSKDFCVEIYRITAQFPAEEKFGLTVQLRRAAVSVPSNIAEGSSRRSHRDFARFLEVATGSGYEIETQLLIAQDLGFLDKSTRINLSEELDEILRMIYIFRTTLSDSI